MDKATFHEMFKPLRRPPYKVEKGKIPKWSQLRGIGVMISSLDVYGNPAPHFRGPGPFKITVHSMELLDDSDSDTRG